MKYLWYIVQSAIAALFSLHVVQCYKSATFLGFFRV